uniref:Lig_chan-Glu_bd domain-containing protein n=1 Tax=Meloidogyne hapla TaxID=6305 RepID=A0A1I8B852_MELHA
MNGSLDPSEEENFLLHLVPGFVVFDNIIPELIYLLNMTGPIVVIFDEQSENLIHDWRKPFTALPVPVRFEKMFSDLSAASMHIKQLSDKAKYNVFIVASAKSAELNFSRTLKTKLPVSLKLCNDFSSFQYLNTPETNKIPQMEEKISLKQLILDIPPQECCEFGSYELYFGDCYYQQEPFVQFASEHPSTISLERPRPCASEEPVRLINGQLVEGYCIDMLKMLKLALNFTFDLYLVGDGKFGSIDENGNWDGLIGELVVGRAEIAIGPISILAERENDIDFTVPFYDLVGLSILIKRSEECLWFCMTSLTPQGGGEAPKNISGRLVAATWWLFGYYNILLPIGPEFSRKPYAIAVQTDHVLKEPLSQAILKLQNERRLETCKERWWHRNEHAKECESSDDDSNGISVQNIGGVFLETIDKKVILAGICISMLILLCEYIYYSRFQDANDVIRGTNKHLAQITGGFNCISALNYLREKKASKYSQEQHKNYQCQQFTNSAFNVD